MGFRSQLDPTSGTSVAHDVTHQVHGVAVGLREEVGVDVEGGGGVAVAESACDGPTSTRH